MGKKNYEAALLFRSIAGMFKICVFPVFWTFFKRSGQFLRQKELRFSLSLFLCSAIIGVICYMAPLSEYRVLLPTTNAW